MGLFDKMKDLQQQGDQAMAASEGMMQSAMAGMAAQAEAAQLANKLGASGIEAQGVIHAIRPTGSTDMSGGQLIEFDVSIKPADGEPFETTIKQSMLPVQMEGLSEGKAITVKYDPDSPTSALIYGW